MTKDLFTDIKDEIRNRSSWEDKQATWYKMRYDGIKRAAKPYPNAPDMHYPLVDTMIDKKKPFYFGQLYGQERFATFVSGKPQSEEYTTLAEKFFDYTVKQRTNFERVIHTSIDYKLMYGRGPIKIRWDAKLKKIQFSAIRPIYIIVPSGTEELGDADWLVHVIHMSESQYRRNELFKQDEGLIKRIKGRGTETDGSGNSTAQQQNILRREGITIGQDDNQIVMWEVYSREDNKIVVDTISPMAGYDQPLRDQFGIPYSHGKFPFADMRFELADEDYYATRGLAEILAHDELSLCKLWNHKLQWLDFAGQPNYKRSPGSTAGNQHNFKNRPGKILPDGVEPVQQPEAPVQFKEEMELHRALAEDRTQVPDLSAGQHLVGSRGRKGGGDPTATQINALMQQAGGGADMCARIFRLQLNEVYGQTWALCCDYYKDEKDLVLEDFTPVPLSVMHNEYRISPSGSADGSSKEQRLGKAVGYKQLFTGDPTINQIEVNKHVLEQDDSNLVRRFVIDPVQQQAEEGQRQAEELVLMERGFAPVVKPGDDHKAHLNTMAGWMERKRRTGEAITPEQAHLALQHSQLHSQNIMQQKDEQGMQLIQKLAPYAQVLQHIIAASQAGQRGGVIPDQALQQPQLTQ